MKEVIGRRPSALRADPGRVNRKTPREARAPQVEEIDLHLGGRVRAARAARGLSRRELGIEIGVGAGVVEKYECGEIRMSASRIFYISTALEIDPGWLYAEFKPGQPLMTDEMFKSLTRGNLEILTQMSGLTYEQRVMLLRTIESFRLGNQAAADALAGASGAG